MSISTSGGNHSPSGAQPRAAAASVIECATVNAVAMTTSGRSRRNGITRQAMKSRWSVPSRMCRKPICDEAQRRLVPARVQVHEPRVAVDLEGALGAAGRQEAQRS